MCLQWKNETAWMKQNEINVELEFASKIKEIDEIFAKIG